MAGNILTKYGTSDQGITCTLASLANGSARQSTYVNNASDTFVDALVSITIRSNSSGTSSAGYVTVYAYGTVNGGTTYTEGASGSDSAITLVSPSNARLVGIVNVVADSTTYYGGPFSIAQAFGGVLPERWGIIVQNNTGAALDSTESNHKKIYQGISAQYT